MKQVFVCCCIAACGAISLFARNSNSQFYPVNRTVITDTVPHSQNQNWNNSGRKDSGYNNKYNSNRNMNADTGRSNMNNMNHSHTDSSSSNRPPQL